MNEEFRAKVRRNLAYIFGFGTMGYFGVGVVNDILLGNPVVVPDTLIVLTTAIVTFYFAKPKEE